MTVTEHPIDPNLDIVLEREVDVPPHLVWAAGTTPEHIQKWFTPQPYETIDCERDVRPGGIFRVVMQSPEGEVMDQGAGCILEAVENERLVWTGALGPGFPDCACAAPLNVNAIAAASMACCSGARVPWTRFFTLVPPRSTIPNDR